MPENISPLSLQEAAAEFSSAPPSRLDDRGFRMSDDGDTPEAPIRPPRDNNKIQSLVGDDDSGSDDSPTTAEADDADEVQVVENDTDEADSDNQDDSSDQTTIDPPKSFTSEEQAEFLKLPPEVQQTLVRRESERDRALMQRMNQVAEERQQLQPLAQQLQQEQQNYLKLSELVFSLGIPEAKEFENVDWLNLSRTDPTAYVEKQARYQDLQQRMGLMANHVQQVQQMQMNQYQQSRQQVVQEQYNKLINEMPEFGDQTKIGGLLTDINTTMQHYGFTESELNGVTDSRIIKVMADLAKMQKAEKTKQAVQAKRTGSPAPKVMTPSGAANRGQNKNVEMKSAMDKLKKTGDIWDAVRVMQLK